MILSYSFLRDFDNCAFKAFRKYVKRDLPPESSPELEKGIQTHKLMENLINGEKVADGDIYLPLVRPYIEHGARAEVMLGMSEDMNPRSFFAKEAYEPWLRGKVDVLAIDRNHALVVDWKTGKVREDPFELFVQSMLVRSNYPEVNKVTGFFVWLKDMKLGKVYDLTDTNETYQKIRGLEVQMRDYEEKGRWPTSPNALCSWCPVADCKFNSNSRSVK